MIYQNLNKLQEDSYNYYFYDYIECNDYYKNNYRYDTHTIANIFDNNDFKIYSSLKEIILHDKDVLAYTIHKVTVSKAHLEKLTSFDFIKCYVEKVPKELIKKLIMLL